MEASPEEQGLGPHSLDLPKLHLLAQVPGRDFRECRRFCGQSTSDQPESHGYQSESTGTFPSWVKQSISFHPFHQWVSHFLDLRHPLFQWQRPSITCVNRAAPHFNNDIFKGAAVWQWGKSLKASHG